MLIRIAANLEKLKANLAEGKAQIEVTTAGMQKLATSLDGSKLEQRAHNITAAINEVGGASKLTDAEARRLLPTLEAWIEKGQRMGKEMPADILKTRDALKQVDDASKAARDALKQVDDASKAGASSGTNWLGVLTKIGGAIGIAFSVGAIKNFVGSVFDSAGQIHDLALQTGLSTDAVQGFKFAAEQAGSSLDAVSSAIGKMSANLGAGDKGTVKALQDAGLGFQQIRNMKPEDAFLAIADAIQKMDDPMKQVEVGRKLMGKGFDELLPAIKEGFRGVSDAADKMSKDTVNRLEEAGDAWSKLSTKVTIVTGEIIANILKNRTYTAQYQQDQMRFGTEFANRMADVAALAAEHAGKIYAPFKQPPPPGIKQTAEQLEAIEAAARKAAAAAQKYADELAKYSGAAATAQLKTLDRVFRDLTASGKMTQEGLAALTKDAVALVEQGGKLPPVLQQMVIESGALSPKLNTAALSARQLGNEFEIALPKMVAVQAAIADLQSKTHGGIAGGSQVGEQIPAAFKPEKFMPMFGADFGASIASSILSAIQGGGNPIAAAAGTVGSTIGKGIAGSLTKEGGKLFQTALGGVLSSALPVIGSLIGPLVGALWGKLFGPTDYEKRVRADNAQTSALQTGLIKTHGSMEQLIIDADKVGINIKEAFSWHDAAALAIVIDDLNTKTEKLGQSSAATAQRQQDALDAITSKYAETISKLDSEYKSLNDSVSKEAEEAVMGLVEAQERARMEQIKAEKHAQEAMRDAEIAAKTAAFDEILAAGTDVDHQLRELYGRTLEIPYRFVGENVPAGFMPSPGEALPSRPSTSTSGRTASGSSVRASSASVSAVPIVLQLDGRVVARNQLRYIPSELVKAGR
jgi:hypothetical protein